MNLRGALPIAAALHLGLLCPAWAQNSVERLRPEPGPAAARAGSAVHWRADLESALLESSESGKPVFWYVPTIFQSFMDRTAELQRYMMGGPFSWPRAVKLLNERFVPVKFAAGSPECEQFSLAPIDFIEPGYLVLDAAGKELLRRDRVTTLHPAWFLRPLGEVAGAPLESDDPLPGVLAPETARRFFRELPAQGTEAPAEELRGFTDAERAEALFLFGAGLFDSRLDEEARAVWRDLAAALPDEPFAHKAALELEGHGPYVNGFETYEELPRAALDCSGCGTQAARGTYAEEDLCARGTRFLLRMQRGHGGFTDSRYDFGGSDSLPNVHVAVTALAASALLEQAERREGADPLVEEGLELAISYLLDEAHVNAADKDEIVWAHAYRARFFSRLIDLRPQEKERVLPAFEHAVAGLLATQAENGAWRHEYQNPFVTATCLIALHHAKRHGIAPPGLEDAVQRGVAVLKRCRSPAGAYSYGISRRGGKGPIAGSAGRGPAGDLALFLWGALPEADLLESILNSFENEEPLFRVRKYDDHSSLYGYGGFFFWFAMHGRSDALCALAAGERRAGLMRLQRERILSLPEIDGCFVDSHELGRSYGTAMALACLAAR
ncbi:MAG: terpene cyclase/mutase family protein [Planctomycetes bacterium]|nr:terpene cyclase/mutase family protein [Planctomycetota bacterium]